MAIQRRMCRNHPDRVAIGVCVITQQAICAECSTRYEGVNYSREGLQILRQRRKAAESSSSGLTVLAVLLALLSPVLLGLMYLGYSVTAEAIMSLVHWG